MTGSAPSAQGDAELASTGTTTRASPGASTGGQTLTAALEPLHATASLVDQWRALAERVRASPFLHPSAVLAWAEAFGAGPLTLATVRRDGDLVAALPLLERRQRLTSAANWHLVETGLLALDEDASLALAASLATAERRLSLALLDAQSAARVRRALVATGLRVEAETAVESPYLDVDGDWPTFEKSIPSKRRSDLRRLRRRLEERGEVTVERIERRDGVEPVLAELIELEAAGWKRERGTAIAQQAESARYYSALADEAAQLGWLRLHVLRLDGRTIAASFGLEAHGVFYGMKLGFDLELRKLAPGRLLLHEVVRDAFEHGLTRVEMLGDDDAYKREWCRASHPRVCLDAFPPTLGGACERALWRYGPPLARRLHLDRLAPRLRGGRLLA